jgi:hypothetical protein
MQVYLILHLNPIKKMIPEKEINSPRDRLMEEIRGGILNQGIEESGSRDRSVKYKCRL